MITCNKILKRPRSKKELSQITAVQREDKETTEDIMLTQDVSNDEAQNSNSQTSRPISSLWPYTQGSTAYDITTCGTSGYEFQICITAQVQVSSSYKVKFCSLMHT